MSNIKMGICVVYFYGKELEWLLDLHLKGIIENTENVNYVIYAAVNRLHEEYIQILKKTERVEIVQLPDQMIKGAEEHGGYLDLLIQHAINNNCSHVCTLDSDSWPISKNWVNNIIEQMKIESSSVSSVLRTELQDFWLPHPCGMILTKEFIKRYSPSMWNYDDKKEFRKFRKESGQRMDTGIAIGYLIWKYKIKWSKLERTNKCNDHFLMAGIYGRTFFHLGAASRLKIFNEEFNQTFARRFRMTLSKFPVLCKYSEKIETLLLKKFPPKVHYDNEKTYGYITSKLKENASAYYTYLEGVNQ